MIARLGTLSESIYNGRNYFKTLQTAFQWATFVPEWKETSLQLIEKIKTIVGPFLAVGVVAAGCKVYEFANKIKNLKNNADLFHGAVDDVVPFVRRGCQLTQWCGRKGYVTLSETASFRLSCASSTLALLFYSHDLREKVTVKKSILVMISALTLMTLFYQSAKVSFAILVLKTSFTAVALLT